MDCVGIEDPGISHENPLKIAKTSPLPDLNRRPALYEIDEGDN